MSTITRNGIEFNVVYIDPSAASAGTGDSYDSPLTAFPSSLSDQTCYLIRRTSESYNCQIPLGNFTTLYNFMIMGMPKSTDYEWQILNDSEVKSAWGYDEYEYANIKFKRTNANNNVNNCFTLQNIINLYLSRCYFFRGTDDVNNGNTQPMFYLTGSGSNLTSNYCKFSAQNCDMDDATWRDNHSDYSNTNDTYSKITGYFWINNTHNNITFNHCTINWKLTDAYNFDWWRTKLGIFISCAKKIEFLNCNFYNMYEASTNSYNDRGRNSCVKSDNCMDYIMMNCNFYNVRRGTYRNPGHIIYASCQGRSGNSRADDDVWYKSKLTLKNIFVTTIRMSGAQPTDIPETFDLGDLYFDYFRHYDVENITADFTQPGSQVECQRVLTLVPFVESSGISTKRIKNIYFKFESNPNLCSTYKPSNNYWDFCPLCIDCAGNFKGYSVSDNRPCFEYSTNSNVGVSRFDAPIFENFNIDCQLGWAMRLDGGVNLISGNIKGKIRVGSGVGLQLDKVYNYMGATPGIELEGTLNYIRIKDYVVEKHNILSKYDNTPQVKSNINDVFLNSSSVYIDKSNCLMFNNNISSTMLGNNYDCIAICPNMQATGQYYQRTQNSIIRSYNVTRTGSNASASLRVEYNYGNIGDYPNTLGQDPYKGFLLQPSDSGNYNVKVYFACKNFEQSTLDYENMLRKMYLEIDVPEYYNGDNTKDYTGIYYSYDKGQIISDNSTWNNETGLTCYVIRVPITVSRTDKPVEVKVHCNLYDGSGIMYLDPDVKLEAV